MDDLRSYEKLSIRESAKSLKKYGSTSKHVTRNQNFIKHIVSSSDTLQGIALKYGVTMEQIRRSNRLWASDSLFLREYLIIPVSDDSNFLTNTGETNSNNHSEVTSPSDLDEDVSSFLVKIDNSIANTIKEVKKSQGNSEFASNLESEYNNERRKPVVSRMKQLVNNNSFSDPAAPPQTVVMSHGRKLRSSLQRLEQQQDELFEL
ncbi:hypothetical protein ILUMI_13695 [Ignelater luminosus]|uniref:LysM domain-containing protein n=1 Tax=Ignelater luminosus TaxID=2038154 RepID=A0A8K0CVQ3_IGNLU|nr:hypothetical protein ILUMI_13695 [Ignelater luminosus]